MEKTAIQIDSFLSFRLMDEIFAVNVSKVLEILEIRPVTKVPKSPDYMRGVINLRGSVLPVVDTRLKFGLPLTEDTVDTCIVVLDLEMEGESITLGALVDGVSEVLAIGQDEVEPAPSIGMKYKAEFIDGMWKKGESFIMLLNIDKVFSSQEVSILKEKTPDGSPAAENGRKTKAKAKPKSE